MPRRNAARRRWRRMRIRRDVLLLGAALLWAGACGAGPGAPTPITVTGTWSGTIVDSASGQGTAQLVMTESQKQVTGTWTTRFADGAETRGSVSGGLLTTLYVLALARDTPVQCSASALLRGTGTIVLDASLNGANRLSGSYSATLCDEVRLGTIDLARQ